MTCDDGSNFCLLSASSLEGIKKGGMNGSNLVIIIQQTRKPLPSQKKLSTFFSN